MKLKSYKVTFTLTTVDNKNNTPDSWLPNAIFEQIFPSEGESVEGFTFTELKEENESID
jgi:hypothetical protein